MSNENQTEELPKVPYKFDFRFLGLVIAPAVVLGLFLLTVYLSN